MAIRYQRALEPRGIPINMETSWHAEGLATISGLHSLARFQQKQLQEKEQKLLQLYDQQQQRAHQVAQRGSAGSNTSNQGTNMNHQTVTKTTATTRTTSTSQGGKVRQMFDERRQTTVKGIDRSYPLEPLDNKSKKQTTNGLTPGKNRNFSKHTVTTVKRTARADVNSNVNDGKPVVSYHEEFNHENFGDNIHDDEFINENDVSRYLNGNQQSRHELFDDEDRNQMGKIHTLDFDKHFHPRVNDLESEQFPEDLMMEMPDKVGKKPLTKKLSQAELRLERFKNSSSKKNITSKSITKKRSDTHLSTETTNRDLPSTKSRKRDRKLSQNKARKKSNSSQQKISQTEICHDNWNSESEGFCQIFRESFFSNQNENSSQLKSTYLIREVIQKNNRKQNFHQIVNVDDDEGLKIEEIENISENSSEIPINEKETIIKKFENEKNSLENEKNSHEDEKNDKRIFEENSKFLATKQKISFDNQNENTKFMTQEETMSINKSDKFQENAKLEDLPEKFELPEINISDENQESGENSNFLEIEKEANEYSKLDANLKLEETQKFVSQKRKTSFKETRKDENSKFQETQILNSPKRKISTNQKPKFEETQNQNSPKRKISTNQKPKFEETQNQNLPKRKMSTNQKPKFEETPKKFDNQKRKISIKFERNDKELEKIDDNIFLDENYCFRNRGRRKIKDSIREKLAIDLRDAIRNKFTLPVKKPTKKKSRDESRNLQSNEITIDAKLTTEDENTSETLSRGSSPEKIFERPSEYQEILIEDQTIDPERKITPSPEIKFNSPSPEIKVKNRRRSVENSETISSAAKRRPSLENRKLSIEKNAQNPKIFNPTENFNLTKNLGILNSGQIFNLAENLNETFNTNELNDKSNKTELKINLELKKPLKSTELVKQITTKNEITKVNNLQDENDEFSGQNPGHRIVKKQEAILHVSEEIEANKNLEMEEKMIQVEKKRKEIEEKIMEIEEKEREVEEKQREFEIRKTEVESKMRAIENQLFRIERENSKIETKKNCFDEKKDSRVAGKRKNWDTVEKLANRKKSTTGEKLENSPKSRNKKIIETKDEVDKSGKKYKVVRETKIANCRRKSKIEENRSSELEKIPNISNSDRNDKNEKEVTNAKELKRTDSVESALRRFDSIENDQELNTSKESVMNKISNSSLKNQSKNLKIRKEKTLKNHQIGKISKEKNSISKTIELKNCPPQKSRKSRRRDSMDDDKNFDYSRISTARDSIELARNFIRNRSPSCKRKLFQDSDSETRKIWKLSSTERQLLTKKSQENCKKLEENNQKKMEKFQFSKKENENEEKSEKSQDSKQGNNEMANLENSPEVKKEEEEISLIEKQDQQFFSNTQEDHRAKKNCQISIMKNEKKIQSSFKKSKESRVFVSGTFVKKSGKYENVIVSRNAGSPSPDFDETRKQLENSKTRRNFGSPSQSPDNGLRGGSVDLKTTRRRVVYSPKKEKTAEMEENFDSSKDDVDSPNLENSPINMESKHESVSPVKKISENFVIDDAETRKVSKKPNLRNEKSVTSQKESSPNPVPRPSSSLSASSGGSSKDKMNSKYKSSTSRGSTPRSSASISSKTDYVDNLVSCKSCNRRFTTDRIQLHEKICAKSGQKKRKQFDAMKFRLQGTDLEPFAKTGVKKQETKQKKTTVKSNWRKTHEDFINTIRSAKQVQAHLAAGGKLSDLPPPPPSDTSDYVQCPHCGRKFNESAAERHIPKCENMRHNKPNPRAPPRPRR